ncbi:hypothetical protein OUZ56_021990 [Daphnia magna]|uniref:Transposase n=1 Tax=Daphnia magna TaxID=35525 RepID=A0ABR0AV14_9CRUS|nr:hypothetical protein OUZ56_021990 [Daphnia magna]
MPTGALEIKRVSRRGMYLVDVLYVCPNMLVSGRKVAIRKKTPTASESRRDISSSYSFSTEVSSFACKSAN